MAGLTIDSFTAATVPLADGNQLPIGQGSAPTQTYKVDIAEYYKYNQRKLSVTSNSMLGGNAVFINGVLTPSVASNNLTITLKTLAGNDPSSTDPVFVVFRSFSLTDGGYVVRAVTGAASFTVNSPNTLGVTAGAAEVFIVGIDDTGPTFRLGVVNPKISASSVYVPDEWALKSATAGNGGNSAGTIYTNATVTNRPIVNLGFMKWTNIATPGTWTLPTSIQTITASSLDARLQEAVNDYLARLALKADLASPTFTGTPAVPTAAPGTNTTQAASTAYVTASFAPLASPTFTGTPAVPTAATDTSTTQAASTAYVVGQAGSSAPLMNGSATVGTSLRYSRQDHVHPSDTSKASLASPALSGVPTTPTAAIGTNTTQIASCAFVLANAATITYSATNPAMDGTASPGVATTVARSDHVHPTDTSRAPTASPTFTGTATFAKASFGSFTDPDVTTLNHIDLWGGTYGLGITTGQLNYVTDVNGSHKWYSSTTNTMLLDSSGNLTAAANITAYSDPRLKENVSPIENARDLISRLQGYRFTWNEKSAKVGQKDIGLLSNEVKEVLPEFVVLTPPDEQGDQYETVAYDRIVSVLISGFNEMDKKVCSLERALVRMADVVQSLVDIQLK